MQLKGEQMPVGSSHGGSVSEAAAGGQACLLTVGDRAARRVCAGQPTPLPSLGAPLDSCCAFFILESEERIRVSRKILAAGHRQQGAEGCRLGGGHAEAPRKTGGQNLPRDPRGGPCQLGSHLPTVS